MNGWGFFGIVLLIIVVVALSRSGWEGLKQEPLQSSWDATKTIGEKTKDAYVWTTDKISDSRSQTGSSKNLGLPLCQEDLDCTTLSECKTGNCTCGESGECFLTT